MPNPAWKPGVSGNPKGRPPVGLSLAAAVRQEYPPDVIVNHATKLLASEDEKTRFAVLQWLAAYGYGKPLSTSEVTVREAGADEPSRIDLDGMSEDKRRAMITAIEEAERLASEAEPDADGATEH